MAKTGKARVLGSSAVILLKGADGTEVNIGEVDKFSAKEMGDLKKSRPLGKTQYASNYDCQGYELSFDGGKVDWKLAALFQAQAQQHAGGGRSPYFTVVQTIKFFDGSEEKYEYTDVTIYDYNIDAGGSGDEVTEKFTGFAASRSAMSDSVGDKEITNTLSNLIANSLTKMTSQQPGDGRLSNYSNQK